MPGLRGQGKHVQEGGVNLCLKFFTLAIFWPQTIVLVLESGRFKFQTKNFKNFALAIRNYSYF